MTDAPDRRNDDGGGQRDTAAVTSRVADGVAYEVIDGEAVLLNLGTSRYYHLNRTATCAWCVVAEGGERQQAAAAITARFEVDDGTALADVSRLVQDLCHAGLLEGGP